MNKERVYEIISAPLVSEKTAYLSELSNQVTFKVLLNANKKEIKTAVEKLFKVKVLRVNTSIVKGKVKRNKYGPVIKSNWKKAYVTLEAGQSIDLMNI